MDREMGQVHGFPVFLAAQALSSLPDMQPSVSSDTQALGESRGDNRLM
jgi:hypothetical protein